MFDLNGFPKLESVYWNMLRPGMVFAGGVSVDGAVPAELRDFPILTPGLLHTLEQRYQFLRGRKVLIYTALPSGLSATDLSESLRESANRIDSLNNFRSAFLSRRTGLLGAENEDRPALESPLVRQDGLILDHWASGLRVFDSPGRRPTLIGDLRAAVTLFDVLSGAVWTKFRFPKTGPFQLHVAVDASFSMQASGRDELVRDTLTFFDGWLRALLPQAETCWHAFSEACAPLSPPFTVIPVPRKETRYETFVRRVLHLRTPDKPVSVLLFTDGMPSDRPTALDHLARFARLGIDYTQIVFRIAEEGYGATPSDVEVLDGYRVDESAPMQAFGPEEQATEAERVRREFSELAITAGGNQIILTVDRALGVVAVEAFDRWLGAASVN